jgi:hypothetical protein
MGLAVNPIPTLLIARLVNENSQPLHRRLVHQREVPGSGRGRSSINQVEVLC